MARREEKARTSIRDRVRERAEQNKHSGGSSYLQLPEGVKFFKVVKSTRNNPTELDIVPFEFNKDTIIIDGKKAQDVDFKKGERWYCRTILVHRKIGAGEKAYICPKTIGRPCPICEERAQMYKNPNITKQEEELARKLKPQVKDIFNVLVDDEIQLLEYSHANFRERLEKEIREGREEWGGFADLEGGYTLEVVFSEEEINVGKQKINYLEASRFDFIERDDIPESILDKVVNLEECLIVLPYDKLSSLFWDDAGNDPEPEPEPEHVKEPERTRRERSTESEPRSSRREPEPDPEPERETKSSRKRDSEPEPEPEEKKATRSNRKREPDPEPESGDCPKGHEFGVDCNAHDECRKCEQSIWESCQDKYDELNPRKRK